MTPRRHPRLLLVAAAAALGPALLAGCGGDDAEAAPAAAEGVSVLDATIDWPANPRIAAVRMVVRNDAAEGDVLVSVSTPVAERTEVHRSEVDAEGQVTMVEQEALEVPARSKVTFEPAGLHVMLTNITDDLQIGDEVPLVLTFEQAGEVRATAEVVEPGSVGADDDGGPHDH
jgi:copper(I)-binding protein